MFSHSSLRFGHNFLRIAYRKITAKGNHTVFNKDCAGASFEELCQNLPGFIEVTEQRKTEGAYQTVNGNSLTDFCLGMPMG